MLRQLIRRPSLWPVGRSAPPSPDRLAFRFVAGVWVACFALLLMYAGRVATRIPLLDEHFNVPLLDRPLDQPLRAYWDQHNEHRIPLPKLLFVAAVKLAGDDFRAPVYMNAVLLAVTAGVLTTAVARARGRYVFADAAVPLIVMNLGQWENLLWGFQIQFFASTILALMMLALVIGNGFASSTRRVAAAGVVTLLLPLCGANGVALVPAFACYLLLVGVANLRLGRRRPGAVALVAGVAGLVLVPVYFLGLRPSEHHVTARSWGVVAENAVNFVGLGWGSVGQTLHGPGPGVTVYAVGTLALLGLTAGLLAVRARDADRRLGAVGVAFVIGGVLCLGLGLAYGRGSMFGVLAVNRYTTLAMPLLAAVYVAWAVSPGRAGRIMTGLMLVLLLGGWWSNGKEALAVGKFWKGRQARTEADIRAGLPVTFVVDRHFPPHERDLIRSVYQHLGRQGFEPFRDMAADPPMTERPVPIRVLRTEGLAERDDWYRVTGGMGHIVFALPDRRHVYGLKVTYEADGPHPLRFVSMASWEPGGSAPPRPGYGIIDNFYPTPGGPAVAHVFVDRETDTFRVDVGDPGAGFRVHAITLLSRQE